MRERRVTAEHARACAPGSWILIVHPDRAEPELSADPRTKDLSQASAEGATAVVHGRFHGLESAIGPTQAHAVLAAHRSKGAALLTGLGGFFSLAVWDGQGRTLFCARDPLGVHPLFWTRTSAGLMLSSSVDTLIRQPEVPVKANRAAVADHLRGLWPRPDETFFEGIRRVPQGHWLRVDGGHETTQRYWDPLFPGQHPQWIEEADLGRFDDLLDEAIARLVAERRPAIYLSGGLDSVSVGAVASDYARRHGEQLPLALSLAFPEPYSEEDLQRSVATQLGIPQLVAGLDDALGGEDIVRTTVHQGSIGAPTQNPWLAAYRWLAAQAAERGHDVILTGSGGDEWLTVSPLYAADLLRSGNLGQFVALGRALIRSYDVQPRAMAKNLVWQFGLVPLLLHQRSALLQRWAPERYADRRFRSFQATLSRRPWLAPDPQLRAELRMRDEESAEHPYDDGALPLSGPREYFREARKGFTHPLVSLELEEVFEYSSGVGIQVVHPYWDTRLVEFLHATPPEFLNRGGRSKGLIRSMLSRRFPDLGFERQRKLITASYFRSAVSAHAPAVWREMDGARALAEAGVIDLKRCAEFFDPRPGDAIADTGEAGRMWEILTAEGWLRHHAC
jgi:asparagine synthase (glutamine-hydrolysing)